MRADYVIKSSVLSEKAYGLSEKKVYTLKVDMKATKADVKGALKDVFNVDALSVNTVIVRGKTLRKMRSKRGGAFDVKRPNFKKAYVTLRPGQELPTATRVVEADVAVADEKKE